MIGYRCVLIINPKTPAPERSVDMQRGEVKGENFLPVFQFNIQYDCCVIFMCVSKRPKSLICDPNEQCHD